MRKFPVQMATAAVVLLWISGANAATRGVSWTRLFDGGVGIDRAHTLTVSGDNVIAAGFLREPDPTGTEPFLERVHVRSYTRGGNLNWAFSGGVHKSQYWDSAADGNGNIYLFGILSPLSGAGETFLVTKVTPAGAVAWELQPQASGYSGITTASFQPRAVFRNGVLYLAGSVSLHATDNDAMYVLGVSPDNTILWETVLTGPNGFGFDGETGLAAGDDGAGGTALVVAGWARDGSGGRGGIHVARIDPSNGSPVWEKQVQNAGPQSQSRGVALGGSKVFVGASLEDPANPGLFAAGVLAFDLAGNEAWRDTAAGSTPSDSNSAAMIVVSGGTLYVAGTLDNGNFDAFVRAYNPDTGSLLWNRVIPGTAAAGGPSFLDVPGALVILGGQFPEGTAGYAPAVVFLDNATGAVADNVVFSSSVFPQGGVFMDGAAGSDGSVFAAGRMVSPTSPNTQDFFVGVAGPVPQASSGGGGGACSVSPVPRRSAPPAWEWALPFAPALAVAFRRRFRKVFPCNNGANR